MRVGCADYLLAVVALSGSGAGPPEGGGRAGSRISWSVVCGRERSTQRGLSGAKGDGVSQSGCC